MQLGRFCGGGTSVNSSSPELAIIPSISWKVVPQLPLLFSNSSSSCIAHRGLQLYTVRGLQVSGWGGKRLLVTLEMDGEEFLKAADLEAKQEAWGGARQCFPESDPCGMETFQTWSGKGTLGDLVCRC